MSGIGIGSKEMRSVLVDYGQLVAIHLMLNDLNTTLGFMTYYIGAIMIRCRVPKLRLQIIEH